MRRFVGSNSDAKRIKEKIGFESRLCITCIYDGPTAETTMPCAFFTVQGQRKGAVMLAWGPCIGSTRRATRSCARRTRGTSSRRA